MAPRGILLLLLHLRQLGEQRRPRGRIFLDRHPAPEHLGQRLGLARGAMRRRQARERLGVVRRQLEEPRPGHGRAAGVAAPHGEVRHPSPELGPGARVLRPVGNLGDEGSELVGEAVRLGQPACQRQRLGRVGVLAHGACGGEEGELGVPERPGLHLGHAAQDGPPAAGVRRRLGARREGLDELLVLALVLVDGLEERGRLDRTGATGPRHLLQSRQRRRMARHLVEHAPVALQRARDVGEALLADAAQPEAQLGGLGHEVGPLLGGRHLAPEHLDELVPALGAAEELPQEAQGVRVLRIDGEDLPVRVHGAFLVGEVLFHHLRHLAE